MRPEDFIEETVKRSDFLGETTVRRFRREVARRLRQGSLDNAPDIEVAVGLARLIHDEFEAFGTGGGEELDDADMREALQALRAMCGRLGVAYPDVPFRDFTTSRTYWIRSGRERVRRLASTARHRQRHPRFAARPTGRPGVAVAQVAPHRGD